MTTLPQWELRSVYASKCGAFWLSLERGETQVEVIVHVRWTRAAGHEVPASAVAIESLSVVAGGPIGYVVRESARAWIEEHGDEIADRTIDARTSLGGRWNAPGVES